MQPDGISPTTWTLIPKDVGKSELSCFMGTTFLDKGFGQPTKEHTLASPRPPAHV